jgi:uncharacterized membrane protein (UPF0127 family)
VSLRIERPTNVAGRLRGLIGREDLATDQAFLLERCRSIHTFGMRFPIKVVWLDEEMRAIGIQTVRPRRFAWNIRARHTLETSVDTQIRLGEKID